MVPSSSLNVVVKATLKPVKLDIWEPHGKMMLLFCLWVTLSGFFVCLIIFFGCCWKLDIFSNVMEHLDTDFLSIPGACFCFFAHLFCDLARLLVASVPTQCDASDVTCQRGSSLSMSTVVLEWQWFYQGSFRLSLFQISLLISLPLLVSHQLLGSTNFLFFILFFFNC